VPPADRWWGSARALAAAKGATEGQVVRTVRTGGKAHGARIIGAGGLAPGPWTPPADVHRFLADYLDPPRYFRPPPPRLPGTETCHGGDEDDLLESLRVAYSAARHRHTGKTYRGHAGRTREAMVEAARMLRAEEVPPHVWFGWVWSRVEGPTHFATLASPRLVGRLVRECPAGQLDRVYLPVTPAEELHALRGALWATASRERPESLVDARQIAQEVADPQRIADLAAAAATESAKVLQRERAKMERGYWVWP